MKPEDITRTDVERFIETLDYRLAAAYKGAYGVTLEAADTLGDDFQLAAAIERCFWDYLRALPSRVEALNLPKAKSGADPRSEVSRPTVS